MSSFEWTKAVTITHQVKSGGEQKADVVISKMAPRDYYGLVLYYVGTPLPTGIGNTMLFKTYKDHANTERDILDKCQTWINNNLGTIVDCTDYEMI